MKPIENVHVRHIAAPPEDVGRLLDELGGPGDRLWPSATWPTTPLTIERPLRVGASSRQGGLTQVVDEYVPGRRVSFRIAPGQPMAGGHRFDVEAAGHAGTRLTHTLTCTAPPWLRPILPIFLRQHDALVEDLFDRAELATTGRVARPSNWPPIVRLANAVELRVLRAGERRVARSHRSRRVRVSATAVPGTLAALSALHAAWALGWRWPGGSDEAFAERVIGYDAEVPPAWATWLVAGLLAGAAGTTRAASRPDAPAAARNATWLVAMVIFARGAVSIPVDLVRGFDAPYERLDIAIYSPLSLLLGAGAATVARCD